MMSCWRPNCTRSTPSGFDLGLTGFEGEELDRLLAALDEGDGVSPARTSSPSRR